MSINRNRNDFKEKTPRVRRRPKVASGVVGVSRALCAIFCIILFAVPIASIMIPDKASSETENRTLKQLPKASFASIFDGSFAKSFESYFNDQFPLRGRLISAKVKLERLAGKHEENGVYIGKSGFLFEKPTPVREEQVESIVKSINSFCKKQSKAKSAFVLSSNASDVLSDKLPYNLSFPNRDYVFGELEKKLNGVFFIDCNEVFKAQSDKTALFYRTDHHWTTKSAYLAFTELSKKWKLSVKESNFDFYPVSTSFSGTLSSSSTVNDCTDKIEVCVPKNQEGKYTVLHETSGKKTASVFDTQSLNKKNQYEVFLGGNFDKLVISTLAKTDRTLLVFKDSYFNCLASMLTPYFSKIVIVDPRYFADKVNTVTDETKFSHILFCYNLDTILADTSLEGLMS